jgi:uncharacterized protein (DUF2147 family)
VRAPKSVAGSKSQDRKTNKEKLQMTRRALTIFRGASLAIIALGAFDANAAQPADVVGVWLSPKANMRVRIGPCGPALCGNIIWLKVSSNPQTGEPLTDRNNPDPANRNRPLLGLEMASGLKPGRAAGEWTGQVYSLGDGKTYDASFSMDGPNGLKVEVHKLGGLLCNTLTWTRVN